MISQEEFLDMLDELCGELPEEFFHKLNGGVILQEHAKLHPKARDNDLWIMGEYCRNGSLGRYVNIYYGSFQQVYSGLSYDALKKQVRHTLRHEFRHHLESLAGEKDLEVVDKIRLDQYQSKKQDN